MKRAIVSGLVMVAGVVLFVVGILDWGDDDETFDPLGELTGTVAVPGEGEVALEEGVHYQVFAMGDDLVRPSAAGPELGSEVVLGEQPTVTLRDATGVDVPLQDPLGTTSVDGDVDGVVIAVVDVPADGTYVLAASGGDPGVAQVGIGEELDFDAGGGSGTWKVVGGTVLFVAGIFGLVFSASAAGGRRMGP